MFKVIYPQWQSVCAEIPYKKFDVVQFDSEEYTISKIDIHPDDDGYCTQHLIDSVAPDTSELVFTNCATGSGKSTAELHHIHQYYQDGWIILKVSPEKNLVRKDYKYIITGDLDIPPLPADEIVLYDELDRPGLSQREIRNLAAKPIHIMTVSCFLRNPGAKKQNQKREKQDYLNAIIKYALLHNKRVVLFMDELHAAIQYCEERLLRNIVPWYGIIRKVFAATATLSEPCYPMICHLSRLVEGRILLLESPRSKLPEHRLAEVEVYFTSHMYATVKKGGIIDLSELSYIRHQVEMLKEDGSFKNLHILCYSRKLAKTIYESGWLDELDFNLTVGKRKNKFVEGKCNIGTTFVSGVNIKDKDLLIVILPPNPKAGQDSWGIFNTGANPVQQAIGRLRNGGKIIVFVPPLQEVLAGDYESTMKAYLPAHLTRYKIVEEGRMTDDHEVIEDYYKQTNYPTAHLGINPPVNEKLPHPTKDMIQLTMGDQIVANTSYSSGKLVYPYFLRAVCCGEFPTCQLPSFVIREYRTLSYRHNPEKIEEGIEKFIEENYQLMEQLIDFSDLDSDYNSMYRVFQEKVVNGIQVVISADAQPNLQSVEFKRALLTVIMKRIFGLPEITLSSFVVHRLLNDANGQYSKIYESILRLQNYFKGKWDDFFPTSPVVLSTDMNLRELLNDFGETVERMFEEDQILNEGIWSLPWKSGKSNPEQIFRFFKKNFVVGSGDTTRDKIRIMHVDHYVIDRTCERDDSRRIDERVQLN